MEGGRRFGPKFEAFEATHSPEKFRDETELEPSNPHCNAVISHDASGPNDMVTISCAKCPLKITPIEISGIGKDSQVTGNELAITAIKAKCLEWKARIASGEATDTMRRQFFNKVHVIKPDKF